MISLSQLKAIKAQLESMNRGGLILIFIPASHHFEYADQKRLDLEKYKGVPYYPLAGSLQGDSPKDAKELIERANRIGVRIYPYAVFPDHEPYLIEMIERRRKEIAEDG